MVTGVKRGIQGRNEDDTENGNGNENVNQDQDEDGKRRNGYEGEKTMSLLEFWFKTNK